MTTVAKGAAYLATSFDDFEKVKLLVPSVEKLDIQFPPGMAEELNAEPTVVAATAASRRFTESAPKGMVPS